MPTPSSPRRPRRLRPAARNAPAGKGRSCTALAPIACQRASYVRPATLCCPAARRSKKIICRSFVVTHRPRRAERPKLAEHAPTRQLRSLPPSSRRSKRRVRPICDIHEAPGEAGCLRALFIFSCSIRLDLSSARPLGLNRRWVTPVWPRGSF
jgi:hypothetical protein